MAAFNASRQWQPSMPAVNGRSSFKSSTCKQTPLQCNCESLLHSDFKRRSYRHPNDPLDKNGRVCHLYLTRDHAIFLHNLLNGDGIQSIAQFRKETLFDDYHFSNQNDDCITFAIDLSLMHCALRSSLTIDGGGCLQIKLVKKLPPGSLQPMPFLTYETKVVGTPNYMCPELLADHIPYDFKSDNLVSKNDIFVDFPP